MLKRGMKPAHPGTLIRENIEGLRAEGKNITIEEVANALGLKCVSFIKCLVTELV